MKVRIAFCVIAALLVFLGASPWEGAAAVAPEGELPSGRYVATNSFPRNTIVDITNIETGRSTRVIVANSLNSPGLLAIVSREAAELIGMRPGSVIRIRMLQPSDPIAYLRFTEGLNADIPDYGNPMTEEELLNELYRNDPYRPPSGDNSTAQVDGTRGPSYTLEQEWRDGRRIIDLPGYVEYPPVRVPETQLPAETPQTPVQVPDQRPVEPPVEPPRIVQPQREAVKDVSDHISEVPRNEADKDASDHMSEVPRSEADKDASDRIGEIPRSEAEKDASDRIGEVPRSEADKDASDRIGEVPRSEADKDASDRIGEVPRSEADKDASDRIGEVPRNEADKDASDRIGEVPRNEADKDASNHVGEVPRDEADKDASDRTEVTTARPVENGSGTQQPVPNGQQELGMNPTSPRPPVYWIDLSEIIPDAPPAARPAVPVTPPVTPAVTEAAFSIPRIYALDRGRYYVQIASVETPESVESIARQIDRRYEPKVYKDSNNRYCILLSPVNMNQGESAAVLQRFKSIGYRDAFVRRGS